MKLSAQGSNRKLQLQSSTCSCAAQIALPSLQDVHRSNRQRRSWASVGSQKGLCYITANDSKIANERETDVRFLTKEGQEEEWTFQIAEVNKVLAAVADRVDSGYRVVFDRDDETKEDVSYMIHKKTGKTTKCRRKGNVWTIDAYVAPEHLTEVFVRRG